MVVADAVQPVVLTDDECVALAAAHGSEWPTGLPTIDGADRRAKERGKRSLLARALSTDDGRLGPALDATVAGVFGAMSRIVVSVGNATFDGAEWGLIAAFFSTDDGFLAESTTAIGLHSFARQAREVVSGFLTDAVKAVEASGIAAIVQDGNPTIDTLCIVSGSAAGLTVVTVRAGELLAGVGNVTDGGFAMSDASAVDVETAVRRVFAAVG